MPHFKSKFHSLSFLLSLLTSSVLLGSYASASNYGDIAKATCKGRISGLKEIEFGAYNDKNISAMKWLRWLYVNEECKSTYIGYGAEANKPLLMAAEAGDASSALTLGRYLLRGGGGFDASPEEAKKWLYKAAKGGEAGAGITLANEYISGETLAQNFDQAEKLVAWLKRNHPSANMITGGIEIELNMARPSKKNKAKAPIKVAKVPSSEPSSRAPAAQKESENSSKPGSKGDLVFTKQPLQRECWSYTDIQSAITDSLRKVSVQTMLRKAKSESVLKYGSTFTVRNYFLFEVEVQDILDKSKWTKRTAVAEKKSFYAKNPPPECRATYTDFDTREQMLENVMKMSGRAKPAKKLRWRRAELSQDTIAKLRQVGVVVQ